MTDTSLKSEVIGSLDYDENLSYDCKTWVSKPIDIPLFAGKSLTVACENCDEAADDVFVKDVDVVLKNFLELNDLHKKSIAKKIFDICQKFIQLTGLTDVDCLRELSEDQLEDWHRKSISQAERLEKLKRSEQIWEYIHPTDIIMSRNHPRGDGGLFLLVLCDSEWDEEHGLQLVFSEGNKLSNLGEQDGTLI